MKKIIKYSGENLRQIKFLLGGIGSGNISLEGRGSLTDWEIFNRPGKGKRVYRNNKNFSLITFFLLNILF